MKNEIEFYVDHFYRKNDRFFIAGRCYKGPIRINDVFNVQYRLIPTEVDDGYGEAVKEDEIPLTVSIKSMRAYQHDLDELDTGLTAEIELIGDVNSVQEGFVLGRK